MTNKPDTLLTGAELLARYKDQRLDAAISLEEMIDKELDKAGQAAIASVQPEIVQLKKEAEFWARHPPTDQFIAELAEVKAQRGAWKREAEFQYAEVRRLRCQEETGAA